MTEGWDFIEPKLEDILNICEKYLEGFSKVEPGVYKAEAHSIKIFTPGDILKIYITRKKIKNPPSIISEKKQTQQEVLNNLALDIFHLYNSAPVLNPREGGEPAPVPNGVSPRTEELYEHLKNFAPEPYINFVELYQALCQDYKKINGDELALSPEKQNNFSELAKIYRNLQGDPHDNF